MLSVVVFGYGAGGMRGRRAVSIAATMVLATTLPLAERPSTARASEGAHRLVDGDGVVHLTNVPADPRYRGLPGSSGTASGWLRLPARPGRPYATEIQEASREYGVSATLVEAVMRAESRFDPTAVSPKGAGGLMQLMPKTASALGVLDRFNPRDNIRGGVRHLRYLLDRYQGSVMLAVAAYNAGEGAVDTHRGVPPYAETLQYVQRVLRDAGMSASAATAPALYRYADSDDALTYSNLPPRPRARDSRP